MAYQSLYRKYRSRDFSDLIGQRHVTQTLANALAANRVGHAYLFCGPRGTGKTSTARVLAKAVNCEHGPTATPCDECPACVAIRQGNALDVIEIDAASNRNIDDIRNLREQVNYQPGELRTKFYIVDEVHQLTRESFNAFLKTLEEPPEHVIFVLCTTDPHQLPATILSRCQRFDFHRITAADIVERLRYVAEQEAWTIEEEAYQLIARTANGGMRDALSLLEQAASYAGTNITAQHVRDILGGIDLDLLLQFGDTLIAKDADALFDLVERVMAEGKDVPQLVGELVLHWRNLLRVKIGGPDALVEFADDQRRAVAAQAQRSSREEIMRAITLWCEADNDLRWNSQQRLVLELYSLRIMSEDVVGQTLLSVPQSGQTRVSDLPPAPRRQVPTAPVPSRQNAVREAPPPTHPDTDTTEPPAPTDVGHASRGVPESEALAPEPVADGNPWTLPRVKHAWPAFIEWLQRSPQLDNLRLRVVEKCRPISLIGNELTLTTASAPTRELLKDRPKVKETLEQCIERYFKAPFHIIMEVDEADETPVLPAPEAPTPPVEIVSTEEASSPALAVDTVAKRVKDTFTDALELDT